MGLGIDFGTSYTAAAFASGGRSRLIELEHDRTVAPTVLFVGDDGALTFGHLAESAGVARPDRVLINIKRDIGSQIPYRVGSVELPVSEAIAAALRFVLEKAKAQIPKSEFGPETPITLTVPATFGESGARVETFKQAAERAGLNPKLTFFVPEPIAAAIGFMSGDWPRPPINSQAVLLVYDLGGGTFDAAAIRLTPSEDAVVGVPVGDESIGGYRFDRAILDALLKVNGKEAEALYQRPEGKNDLNGWRGRVTSALRMCRDVKEGLSLAGQTHVQLPDIPPPPQMFTAADLNRIIAPYIETTAAFLERLCFEIKEIGLSVEGVLLVGGSCRLPIVSKVLRERLGLPLLSAPDPARIVAVGAAINAMRRGRNLASGHDERRGVRQRNNIFQGFFAPNVKKEN